MRTSQIVVLALAIGLLPSQASANLPFLLVSLEAQRAKCVSQHPQLKPALDAAFERMAAKPPAGIPAADWRGLLSTTTLSTDALPGTLTVEECRSFIAGVGEIDFNAILIEMERAQARFEASQREPEQAAPAK